MWAWFLSLFFDNVGLIPFICIFILILLYIYLNKKLELFWLCCYYIFCLNFIAFILFFYADIILIYFLDQVLEPIIVSDPAIFTYNYFYFILNLSFLLSIPFLLLLFYFYISSIKYMYNTLTYNFLILLFIYYLIISFWIAKYDLFFSNWFSLAYMPQFSITFDFQPNFEKFLNSFWIEYQEFFLFCFFIFFMPFWLILIGKLHYFVINIIWKYIFFFTSYIFILYFFFEFSLINNFILYILIWLLFLFLKILWLFLDTNKHYKF